MLKEFRVPYTNYVFVVNVSPSQIINPTKYWRRYLRGRRNPLAVGRYTSDKTVERIK